MLKEDTYKIKINRNENKFQIYEEGEDGKDYVQTEGFFDSAKHISEEFYYLIKGTISNAINQK
ncbi:hypothetical protein FDB50_15495 [Clostridium botulinum]|uniref:Uncharacterized protein n=1 Tax=Clostridium botulinum TaxID=1491 RepID=A0A846JTV6_CLOBO|nr:hypothetical protein [Clostridium botulinum]NFL43144.1 hypothetical protein [Clostridium botulinum]NFN06108.1 hypothetical protein [Clostridium botulinum]NFN36444.1 hypothetical protein [Clostridium botulinum]HBJ1645831.1 hypothetical protein [Clostridium botulinum]